MVVLSHLTVPGVGGAFYVFENSGYSGVTFFYVLSGFVLAYNYFDTFKDLRIRPLWNFVISRLSRVYPIYIFILFAVGWWEGISPVPFVYVAALQAWSPDISVAFGIVGPSWSISVEMFLYASFPLMAFLIHKLNVAASPRKLLAIVAAVVLAMLCLAIVFTLLKSLPYTDPNSSHRWIYRSPINRLGDFSLGIFAALFTLRFPEYVAGKQGWWRVLRWAACAFIVWLMTHQTVTNIAFRWDVAYAIPFAIIILSLAMAEKSILVRFLGSRFMFAAGEISFAFYLVHVPASEMWNRIDLSNGIPHYIGKFIFISIVASGIHFAFERPVQVFLKRTLSVKRSPAETAEELVALKT
jgi:peptidoglycan/LPS O-acetylase OafA/YrhL